MLPSYSILYDVMLHTTVQPGQCCRGAEDVIPLSLCPYGRKSLTYAGWRSTLWGTCG